jgi:uncharacterized protein (TIGR02594 family)
MALDASQDFESQKLRLERQKAILDYRLKRQELRLKGTESAIRERELAIKETESARARWLNPMTVSIAAAALALIGNGVVALVNGLQTRQLEAQKAQDARVLEMIKVSDGDKAINNLKMLLEAGLYVDPDGRMAKYVEGASPESVAVLPAPQESQPRCTDGGPVEPEVGRSILENTSPEARRWMSIAVAELGVSECSDAGSRRIVEYLNAVVPREGYTSQVPWSAAYIGWVMSRAGLPFPRSLANAAWRNWGVEASGPAKVGAVVTGKPVNQVGSGLLALYIGEADANSINVLGGNIRNQVRLTKLSKANVLSYRWPEAQ